MIVMIRTSSALSSPLLRSARGLCSANRSLPSTSPSLSGPYGSGSLVARRTSLFTTSFTFALDDLLDKLLDAFLNAISLSHPLAILPSLSSTSLPQLRFLNFASSTSLPPRHYPPVAYPALSRSTLPQAVETHLCTWSTLNQTSYPCLLSTSYLGIPSLRHPISASPPFDVPHLVSLSPSTRIHTALLHLHSSTRARLPATDIDTCTHLRRTF